MTQRTLSATERDRKFALSPQVLAKTPLEPAYPARSGSIQPSEAHRRRYAAGDGSQASAPRVVSREWYTKSPGLGTTHEQLFLALTRVYRAEPVSEVNEWAQNVVSSAQGTCDSGNDRMGQYSWAV